MKLKSILIMLALLGLGFVMGMLTSGQLMKKEVSKIAKTRTAEGLEERIFSIIEAEDGQKETLRNIIRPYSIQLEQIRKENKDKLRPVLDSMKTDIEKELTPEQALRFQKFIKRMKRPFNHPGKHNKDGKKRN